ncbi:hypothetical protein Q5424_09335 [Conexibacter sp. JD483]|uniref:hypothetical protein n=1 Tax=unclassified Conexibacter TaxID=2627773 RepID=UPI0027178914|nr:MULTISPECIES: hypothetical protein [unclassified Conexibacter]MDO8187221.1 hypothetical protein [Conexibacter sp. CPCC 205706]MDO8199318.1 hypothetical protein [Conexibacter sp. CPCC 205762]MDR9369281.1 hypothetical protein [Conexibacter sp. JD483]
MADGDVILPLDFGEGPDFAMGSCGRELYEALAPLAYDDELYGWPLATLCEALGRMRQPISDLVRAWNEPDVEAYAGNTDTRVTLTMPRSGWSRAAHPSEAPGAPAAPGSVDLLPFVGQLVGVRGIEQLSNDDRREAIKRRDGYSRGQLRSILSYARSFTDGDGVTLRERYNPDAASGVDAPYRGRVVIKRSRVRGLARVNMIANPRAEGPFTTVRLLSSSTMTATFLSRVAWTWSEIDHAFAVEGTLPDDQSSGWVGIAFSDAGRAAHPVVPGLPYTASVLLAVTDASFLVDGVRWVARWFDSNGAPLATVEGTRWATLNIWGFPFASTWVAPPGAAYGQFSVEQKTDFPNGDRVAFEVTAAMLEQTARAGEFGDALTPGWRPLGALNASPAQGPGLSADEFAARILKRIPAGLRYDVWISDELDFDDVKGTFTSYADLLDRTTGYNDLLED